MPRLLPRSFAKYPSFLFSSLIIGFLSGLLFQWILSIDICLRSVTTNLFFYEHFSSRTQFTCRNPHEHRFLTVAVLSSDERLIEYLPSMLETWMMNSDKTIEIIIFLEENRSLITEKFLSETFDRLNNGQSPISACFYLVQLKHVINEYPPQKKSFHAMKFLWSYYRHRTSWILRLDDNAYVHLPRLIHWLKSIDHHQTLYIGQGGTGRRNGPAIHFPPGQYFCMGGSGVILSQQTLIQLGPWLDQCLTKELRTHHEDVELGRCISEHIHISCNKAFDSKHFFYHHYGPTYEFASDFTPSILSRAMILHPIKSRQTFRQIFAYHLREEIQRSLRSKIQIHYDSLWVTFLPTIEFDLIRDIHYQRIDVRWKFYIQRLLQSYVEHFQKMSHQRVTNWTVINAQPMFGYHRVNAGRSVQLIVEILLNIRTVRPTFVRKRLYFYQTLFDRQRLNFREIDAIDRSKQLNLIIVAKDKDQELKRFLENYQNEILKRADRRDLFQLNVLYFPSTTNLSTLLQQYSVRYPTHLHISIWNKTETIYNRGLGRHLASQSFSDDAFLLFLDIDLIFTGQALINIRQWMFDRSAKTSTCFVFFPIIFSIFSIRSSTSSIHSQNGLFSIYGFGNVALRKKDLDRLGGWEKTNHFWGSEDVHLFDQFINRSAHCDVFRVVEPGFRHAYHRKKCEEIPDRQRQMMCRTAEANLRASQFDLVSSINRFITEQDKISR